jgi:hypothetical protein
VHQVELLPAKLRDDLADQILLAAEEVQEYARAGADGLREGAQRGAGQAVLLGVRDELRQQFRAACAVFRVNRVTLYVAKR